MKKILFLILFMFVGSLFAANNLDVKRTDFKKIELSSSRSSLTLTPTKNVNYKLLDVKTSDSTDKVEEVVEEKYESKLFKVNKNVKAEKELGNYFIKGKLPLITDFEVKDVPNDGGGVIEISWKYESKHGAELFEIFRKTNKEKSFTKLKDILVSEKGKYSFRDSSLDDELTYTYKVRVKKDGLYSDSLEKETQSETAIFNMDKLVMLIAGVFLVLAIMFFIRMARTGKELYIRRIAGLDAVDDAVGRATEMGREIMFIPGITDIDDPQTIAALTILGRVSKLTAQYKTPLSVPVSKSMVMVTGREIVKESYLSTGRPENFQDGMIYYLTDDQFGFAAGVDGIMVREKPATIFLQGAFYAESLILAETGHHIGAIQISGTAVPSQLPFFITACDYTLMGEEIYAASAYLSRDPQLLGSLRGQDAGKALIIAVIVIGIVLETIVAINPEWEFLSNYRKFFKLK